MAHLRVQHQIRENNMEVMDYMRELEAWEKTVKSKDMSMRQPQAASAHDGMPPVRGRVVVDLEASAKALEAREKKKRKKQRKKQPPAINEAATSKPASAAGHTYDYFRDKWDKFDVEKALREADSSASSSSEDSEEDSAHNHGAAPPARTDAPMPVPSRATQDSGARGRDERASVGDDGGVAQQEESAEYLKEQGNLLFKKGMYSEAVEYYGRSARKKKTAVVLANAAMANLKLDRFEAAVSNCTEAIAVDPTYVKSYWRRGSAYRRLGRHEESTQDFEVAVRLEPTNGELRQEFEKSLALLMQWEKLAAPSDPVMLLVETEEQPDTDIFSGAKSFAPPSTADAPQPSNQPVSDKAGAAPLPAASERKDPEHQRGTLPTSVAERVAASLRGALLNKLAPPTNASEFETTWKTLGAGPDAAQGRAQYLRIIPPPSLPRILKDFLTAPLLASVLGVLQSALLPDDAPLAVDILEQLTYVGRFDMTVMFLTKKEREDIKSFWDTVTQLGAQGTLPVETVLRADILKSKYRVK